MASVDETIFGGDEEARAPFAEARIVVLPAPLERTVSYGGGTRHGPAAILRASCQVELFDEETGRPYWGPRSLHTLPPVAMTTDPEQSVAAIAAAARPAVDAGKFLLTLGGEHTVTAGAFRPVARKYPGVGVLIFDAHLDLRAEYDGTPWSHACVARRLIEEHDARIEWCGIRSVSPEEFEYIGAKEIRPFYAHELDPERRWIPGLVERLPERVYLSIDIDGLDPAYVPGTGTPEPGGLGYRDLLALIRAVAARRHLVGADIVEVAPIPGQQVSEFTAARVAAKLLGAIAD